MMGFGLPSGGPKYLYMGNVLCFNLKIYWCPIKIFIRLAILKKKTMLCYILAQ